jgi:hypothetical protein
VPRPSYERGLPDSAIEAAASVNQWLSSPLSNATSSLIAALSCRSSNETWSRSQANDAIASVVVNSRSERRSRVAWYLASAEVSSAFPWMAVMIARPSSSASRRASVMPCDVIGSL